MAEEQECRELGACTIVVTCVVLRRGTDGVRTLILKRSETEDEGPGLWTIPGGKLQACDLGTADPSALSHGVWTSVLERAVLREIREETGIQEQQVKPMFLPSREKVFRRKNGTLTLVFVFWTEQYYGEDARAGEGATECRWVYEHELDGYTFIGNVKDDIRAAFQAFCDHERELRRPYVCDMDH